MSELRSPSPEMGVRLPVCCLGKPGAHWDSTSPCGSSHQTLQVSVGHALNTVLGDHSAVFMEEGVMLS